MELWWKWPWAKIVLLHFLKFIPNFCIYEGGNIVQCMIKGSAGKKVDFPHILVFPVFHARPKQMLPGEEKSNSLHEWMNLNKYNNPTIQRSSFLFNAIFSKTAELKNLGYVKIQFAYVEILIHFLFYAMRNYRIHQTLKKSPPAEIVFCFLALQSKSSSNSSTLSRLNLNANSNSSFFHSRAWIYGPDCAQSEPRPFLKNKQFPTLSHYLAQFCCKWLRTDKRWAMTR